MNSTGPDAEGAVHELISPEGVRLDLPIAGPGLRILAYGIDLGAILLLLGALMVVTLVVLPAGNWFDHFVHTFLHHVAHTARQAAREASAGRRVNETFGLFQGLIVAMFLLAHFAIEFGYFIVWEMMASGRSLGKYIMGLRVVRRDGSAIDLRASAARNLMRIVDMLPENYVVGLIAMVLSPSGERLGDHVAGTIVIRLDRPQSAIEIVPGGDIPILSLTRAQQAKLGEREMRLIRAALRRAESMPTDRADAMLAEVSETLCARLELHETPRVDQLKFLRSLLAAAERYSDR